MQNGVKLVQSRFFRLFYIDYSNVVMQVFCRPKELGDLINAVCVGTN